MNFNPPNARRLPAERIKYKDDNYFPATVIRAYRAANGRKRAETVFDGGKLVKNRNTGRLRLTNGAYCIQYVKIFAGSRNS
jgi:hypothetical protein